MVTAHFLKDSPFDYALPRPIPSEATHDNIWHDLLSNIEALPENASKDYAKRDSYSGELESLLLGVFEHSRYLTDCLVKEPQAFIDLCERGWVESLASILGDTRALLQDRDKLKDIDLLMKELRVLKRRLSLVLGLVDLSGRITLSDLTEALSQFASLSVEVALGHMWHRFSERGYLQEGHDSIEGIFVLGMGKLGGLELNYSSDIDLILFFDAPRVPFLEEHLPQIQEILNRGVKYFVKILDEVNRDGFVFRVDLDLRPDPLSMPPIVSVVSALNYYEAVGRTWERSAYIKACVIAGDNEVGNRFLKDMTPFIWRKSLDYYALNEIADVRTRMMNTKTEGEGEHGIGGFNLKLSYGGIREVEFLIQSQQMIWGGRNPFLRTQNGAEALNRLVIEGIMPERVVEPLTASYAFFRQVEHRLQMQMNEQTQTLPKDADALKRFVAFCGYADVAEFAKILQDHVGKAKSMSDEFGPKEIHAQTEITPESIRGADLVRLFTAPEISAEDEASLAEYGFTDTKSGRQIISGWFAGDFKATRSEKSIEHLSYLLPILLTHIKDSGIADETLTQFDKFLRQLPYGVQIFALLQAHPELCRQLFAILGGAPTVGGWLSDNPHLLDALLEEQTFSERESSLSHLDRAQITLKEIVSEAKDLQDILQALPPWLNDQKFLCRLAFFNGNINIEQLMQAETQLAELTMNGIVPQVIKEFNDNTAMRKKADKAPIKTEDYLSFLAFGKFGSKELLPLSDLDMVFLFDADADEEIAYGLSAMVYFVRLCQRILTALSVETGKGKLYPVDMRLRPSGNKSSIATPVNRFADYYLNGEAWIWEWMTLLRGRSVWGSDTLKEKIHTLQTQIFRHAPNRAKIIEGLQEMWSTTRETHKGISEWDVKYRSGGLQDLEYVIYGSQLCSVAEHSQLIGKHGLEAIATLQEIGVFSASVAQDLASAYRLWMSLSASFKLICETEEINEESLTSAQIESLCRMVEYSCGLSNLSDLGKIKELMTKTANSVKEQLDILFKP